MIGEDELAQIATKLGVSYDEAAQGRRRGAAAGGRQRDPDGALPAGQDLDAVFDKLAKSAAA